LLKLAATGADRQIIQRSVAAVAAQCTAAVFAVLLKHYGRVADAIAWAEQEEEEAADPLLLRLWRKAAEIKIDIRTEQGVSAAKRQRSMSRRRRGMQAHHASYDLTRADSIVLLVSVCGCGCVQSANEQRTSVRAPAGLSAALSCVLRVRVCLCAFACFRVLLRV